MSANGPNSLLANHPQYANTLALINKYGLDQALLNAAETGQTDIVRLLYQMGANIMTIDSVTRGTPLHAAAFHGHTETVRALCELGADKEAIDIFGKTPLHDAAVYDRFNTVRVLCELDANIEAIDMWALTPLQRAERNNNTKCAEAILTVKYQKMIDAFNKNWDDTVDKAIDSNASNDSTDEDRDTNIGYRS
jgi:ankyrin repeat protein